MPIDDDYAVYCDAKQDGILHVKLVPCKPDGSLISDDEDGWPPPSLQSPGFEGLTDS